MGIQATNEHTTTPFSNMLSITPAMDAILQATHRYHLMTVAQVRRLLGYSQNSLARVQRLVKLLTDHNYLLSLSLPVSSGRAPYVYSLSRKGLHYLKAAGFDVREYFRPAKEREKSYLFLRHTLALNDVLIAAETLVNHTPAYYLSTFVHERVLQRHPYTVTIELDGKAEKRGFSADALLDFRQSLADGTEQKILLLYEHDMGTMEQKNFRKKIRNYIAFIRSLVYKEALHTNTITIACATPKGERRREQMRDWTRLELAQTKEPKGISDLFLFAALPQDLDPVSLFLKPCWLRPFQSKELVCLLPEESRQKKPVALALSLT